MGKSTIVSKVVLRVMSRGVIVGGCITSERRVKGQRVGFAIKDLTSGTEGELASLTGGLGPRVGRYRVNLTDLASVGAKGLVAASVSSELIVIDEAGPMELVSPEFRRAVKACIASGKPLLAVVHERMQDDLLEEMRASAEYTAEVTLQNREGIVDELSGKLLEKLAHPGTN